MGEGAGKEPGRWGRGEGGMGSALLSPQFYAALERSQGSRPQTQPGLGGALTLTLSLFSSAACQGRTLPLPLPLADMFDIRLFYWKTN